MKKLNDINSNNVISLRLSQLKSYFKIIDISYFTKDTNLPIIPNIIERVIRSTHIFDNIVLASYLHIIKILPKSNMAVI